MFRFPSPDRTIFLRRVKKKQTVPDTLVKAANTLIYKYTILFYLQQLVGCDVLVFNLTSTLRITNEKTTFWS